LGYRFRETEAEGRSLMPACPVLYVGSGDHGLIPAVDAPVNLEEFKRTIHNIAV
jgi:hypothetical protein